MPPPSCPTPPLIATAIRSPMGLSFPDENRQNAENLSPVYHVFPAGATYPPAENSRTPRFSALSLAKQILWSFFVFKKITHKI